MGSNLKQKMAEKTEMFSKFMFSCEGPLLDFFLK